MPDHLRNKKFLPINISQPKAFSFVEILLVVILLSVITGLAVANFRGTFDYFQLSETAKNIATLMRYAQSRAVIKNLTHEIQFDLNRSTYRLAQEISAEDEDENPQGVFLPLQGRFGRTFSIPKEVMIEARDSALRFYPEGKIDKGRIYLHNKRQDYFTISTQDASGYVEVYDFKIE